MDTFAKLMKKKGQRFTSQKKKVLSVLHKQPQTVLEILQGVKSNNSTVDKATVYRILTSFIELGIVKEIHLGHRETRYELTNTKHHHHLVCESCGDIEDVKLNEDIFLKEVKKQTSFLIKSHSLEFFGTCRKCQ